MTNNIQELGFDLILPDLKVANSKDVLQALSKEAARMIGTSEENLFAQLWEQEQTQTSGIGHGVAISHMPLPRLTKPFIIFTKLSYAINFDSADNDPVDMICLVLSPEHEGPKHLQRLSEFTRLFNDSEIRKNIRNADDADDIRITLKEINTQRRIAA